MGLLLDSFKILGQGHDEDQPKSNQVIYRSGPSILLDERNMKSCSDVIASAAGGGIRGSLRTDTKNQKVTPITLVDLIDVI